jgi:hypothetical protein
MKKHLGRHFMVVQKMDISIQRNGKSGHCSLHEKYYKKHCIANRLIRNKFPLLLFLYLTFINLFSIFQSISTSIKHNSKIINKNHSKVSFTISNQVLSCSEQTFQVHSGRNVLPVLLSGFFNDLIGRKYAHHCNEFHRQ